MRAACSLVRVGERFALPYAGLQRQYGDFRCVNGVPAAMMLAFFAKKHHAMPLS